MGSALAIALVLERYAPRRGGLEAWTDGFACWLLARGHRVSALCFGGHVEDPAIRLRILDDPGTPLARAAAIEKAVGAGEFDIVHDMGFGQVADVFQPHTGSRLVNAALEDAALPRGPWLRRKLSPGLRRLRREMDLLERRQFAEPGRLIAVSRMVRDQIARRYGLRAGDIAVIRNGVDVRRFAPERLAGLRVAARSRWGFGDAVVFLLVANNFLLKGLGTALRALARMPASPGIRLAVAGTGDAGVYQALARRLGVADRLCFLGHLDRIEEAYAAADVGLQPTHYDACSLVTLEGLASGLPTITTRANGAAELMQSGAEGILLEQAGDCEALAEAMGRLLDPSRRREMAVAARRLGAACEVADNYRAVEEFYGRALDAAARRRGTGRGNDALERAPRSR